MNRLTNSGTGLSCPAHSRRADASCDHAIRSDELHPFARFDHLPPAFMDEAVVVVAEGQEVGQVARPAQGPELDVMRSRPVDGPVASRSPAPRPPRRPRPSGLPTWC